MVSQECVMLDMISRVCLSKADWLLIKGQKNDFPLLLETSNAFRVVTQTYFNSDHTIDFCVVKVFIAF